MADNFITNAGSGGNTYASDDIAGIHYPRTKVSWGVDGVAVDASATNPLPTVQTGSLPAGTNNIGDVDVLTLPALPAGTNNIGDVDVLTLPATTNAGATAKTSDYDSGAGTDTVTMFGLALPASGGAVQGGTATNPVRTDPTGTTTQPVSGTVTANLAAGTNNIGDVDILTIAAGDNNIGNVDIVTVPAPLSTTGGGTEAAALRVTIATDSTGVVSIDDNGGSITVDGSVSITGAVDTELTTADLDTGAGTDTRAVVGLVGSASGGGQLIPGSATDGLLVNLGTNNDVTVTGTVTANLAAGTNNIGDIDVLSIAAGDNNIGNVDIVTMPNVTLAAGTNTNEVVGDVAHDAAAAGNPVLIAASAETMADSAPANRVSADADATRLSATDGALFVIPCGPQTWSYHVNGSSALTDATVKAAPGAGLSLYVTDIVISSGAATAMNAFFEESTTTVLGPYYLEAVAGRGCAIHFGTPKKITANTALTVTTSAAIAHSIDVTGFIAPG